VSGGPRPVASEEKSRRVNICLQVDLGLIPYAEAHALQKRIVVARKLGLIDDVLIFCEHPHVITQDVTEKREHLLASESVLRSKRVLSFFETSRGGDVTYHGPGQIVAYPILNLADPARRGLVRPAVGRSDDSRDGGIWNCGGTRSGKKREFGSAKEKLRELAAIGVPHQPMDYFAWAGVQRVDGLAEFRFDRCRAGIADRKATSLEKLLGRSVKLDEVRPKLAAYSCRNIRPRVAANRSRGIAREVGNGRATGCGDGVKDWRREANGENAHTASSIWICTTTCG